MAHRQGASDDFSDRQPGHRYSTLGPDDTETYLPIDRDGNPLYTPLPISQSPTSADHPSPSHSPSPDPAGHTPSPGLYAPPRPSHLRSSSTQLPQGPPSPTSPENLDQQPYQPYPPFPQARSRSQGNPFDRNPVYGHVPPPGHNVGYAGVQGPGDSVVWSEREIDPHATPFDRDVKYKNDGRGGDNGESDPEADGMVVREKKVQTTEMIPTTRARRWWIYMTWALTWWVPSFLLIHIGRLKRADVRMAWREKLAIFEMIIFACAFVLFYIILFGRLLCPDSDKAWNTSEMATHQGEDDFYAAIAGKVYDFTKFYKGQHSDLSAYKTTKDVMLEFAGQDLTNYFPIPLTVACPTLVTSADLVLMRSNFSAIVAYAVHTSGPQQTITGTKLNDINWYKDRLTPDLKKYYKGSYVYDRGSVQSGADSDSKQWAIYNKKVYDLTDYLNTVSFYSSSSGTDLPNYSFLNEDLAALFQTSAGQDITSEMQEILDRMSPEDAQAQLECLDAAFYQGQLDFRKTARCTVQNYLLLAFSIIMMVTIGAKFLAALQLGSKRHPELQDKFVICQVPCYTEGEESLKRTIDSLAALNYDDKRKLIFIICDGNIVGSGNNRPTPRIVLDLLGVDEKLDPEPLLFKSIGEGSKQLNYAKVYSGLYEFEGHVVPYVVVVKVGKPSETSKPGNRGKRDSQVLLMQYLNRVHFDAAMSPLELEIYHQMRNVIGIDPTFYEYIFQVDADTTVEPNSLNRMISCTSDDQRIIGICGETKLSNENESLTTMIQVYEYFISHHLTKAFESLFGSVTCLPGCFSVYRIRTAEGGRPVIISSIVIDEYAEPNVDTLHKKNLFSLGEDRYLTTLMMKHFPTFKMKFTPDARAHTVAPSRWDVLLSQRRRWINSTVHNLVELLFLPEMCGFCMFSMRWIVFLDLLGTVILPSTCGYLIYLVVAVSTKQAPIPIISLAMIAAVYGLQALIFIIKREFMLVGWMVVYILAFPIYSVFLPLYSFWCMDDFSWGNTRKVVGEGSKKTVLIEDDEVFTENMIPYRTFKEYEGNAWETASVHSRAPSMKSSSTGYSRASRNLYPISNRAPSFHSSVSDLPDGANYWRDSSPLGKAHESKRVRSIVSTPSLHHQASNPFMGGGAPRPGGMSRVQSMAGMSMWGAGSVYDPQGQGYLNPMMTGGSYASAPGYGQYPPTSMYGSPMMGMGMGMPMGPMGGMGPIGGLSPQATGQAGPRGTMMSFAGGGGGGGGGGVAPRMSSYSLGQGGGGGGSAVDSAGGASAGTDKLAGLGVVKDKEVEDEVVLEKLRAWLGKQDLMSVTKRQTREAVYALFPNAELNKRTAWLNEQIDKILGSM